MNYSKKSIMKAFWELLEETPYSKITVKLIVERCGVNRNTFYYYFKDIPSLGDELLRNKIDQFVEKHCRVGSLEECITLLVNFFTDHQKITMNIYHSMPYDIFVRHLDQMLYHLVSAYIENIVMALKITVENKELTIRLFKCLLVGVFLDWLDRGMPHDILDDCMQICKKQKGANFQFLLNASAEEAGAPA